jgi:hypothetical protein
MEVNISLGLKGKNPLSTSGEFKTEFLSKDAEKSPKFKLNDSASL